MRTVSFDIPPQEILTKDSVTIAVDAVVYYKISNANGKCSQILPFSYRFRSCDADLGRPRNEN